MSEPMKRMGNSAHELTEQVNKSSGALDAFAKLEIGKMAVEGAEKIYDWGKSFVEFVVDVNEAYEATKRFADFNEGSKEAGDAKVEQLTEWSKQTGISIKDVRRQYQDLANFQERWGEGWARVAQEAAGDVRALSGAGKDDVLLHYLERLSERAKISKRAFFELDEMKIKGLSSKSVSDLLAKQLNIVGPDIQDQVIKRLNSMKDGAKLAASTVVETINQSVDKGAGIGTEALEVGASTMEGAINRVKVTWDQLFEGIDLKPITSAVNDFAKAIDPATASGKEIQRVGKEAFNDIKIAIDFAHSHLDEFTHGAEKSLHALENIVKFISDNPTISKIMFSTVAGAAAGSPFGPIGAAIGAAGAAVTATVGFTGEKIRDTRRDSQFKADKAGFDVINKEKSNKIQVTTPVEIEPELVDNFAKSADNSGKAFHDHFIKSAKDWKDSNQEQSPSKLWEDHGINSGEGYNIGWNNSVNPQVPGFGSGSFGGVGLGTSGPTTISIENHFDGGVPTDPAQIEKFNEKQKESLETGFIQLVERLAQQ
jgi:hypothetical protein